MQIEFKPDRQEPSRKGSLSLDKVQLNPGINEVPDEITNHPFYHKLLKQGAIVVLSPLLPQSFESLAKMSVKEAEPIITKTSDRELLKKWLEKDDRKGITEAIEKRLEELDGSI
ncbi:MAG: hypothetical protein J7647_26220 [Cyanobacteria bacterium SBLK]|nr:hypothetical protein [Cyanobacteria bacterium SBLK]